MEQLPDWRGRARQTLHCSRFDNQQGIGVAPVLANSAISEITKIQNKVDIADEKRKIKEKALESIIDQVGDITNLGP